MNHVHSGMISSTMFLCDSKETAKLTTWNVIGSAATFTISPDATCQIVTTHMI